jgi:hypothetical protein
LALAASTASWGHDASADVATSLTTTSSDNPRTGSVSAALTGSYDFNDAWNLGASLLYTRDLATKTPTTSSAGSNVFLLGLSAAWMPSAHWIFLLNGAFSPPTEQRSATTVTSVTGTMADVIINSRTWSLGGLLTGGWSTAGDSAFESSVDVLAGVNEFNVFQQAELGNTPVARALRATCETAAGRRTQVCALVNGTATPLLQGRLGLGYVATLFGHFDVGLEGSYYLYDRDPDEVGYFAPVLLGRTSLGSGVPVLPMRFSLKPSLVYRFSKVTLRANYVFGQYTSAGTNHAVTVKVTWKVTHAWRLSLAVTGQVDLGTNGNLENPGGNAVLGVLLVF